VRHFGFLVVLHEAESTTIKKIVKSLNGNDFIVTIFTPANINQAMPENIGQIIILLIALGGWVYCAFPTLRYIVDASEGNYKWQLAGWFLLLTVCIFGVKMSLYSLTGWPSPGTWNSRLFYLYMLTGAYLLPFLREYILHWFRKITGKNPQ